MEKGRCTHKYLTVKKYPRTFIVERCLSFFLSSFLPFFLPSFFPSFSVSLFGRVSKPVKEIYIFFFGIRFRLPRNRKSGQGQFVCSSFAHSLFCKFVLFLLSWNCTKIQEIYLLSLNNTLLFSRFRKLENMDNCT